MAPGLDLKEILRELEVPISPDQVQWRVTVTANDRKRGQIVPYADPRAYTDRLNVLFSPRLDQRLQSRDDNAIAWPGISIAVTTCLLTALTTIGSSRQKQVLRIAGAIVGGFLLGMGAQIFILPYLDSIAGFVVLFAAVTAISAWVMTSSPRLSYFGFQVALAFYLINLSEFKIQTSLAVARDRVVGILFGLFMMWLVFDQLWGVPAAVQMKKTFISNLRLLAQFVREPVGIARRLALGETINSNLDQVRALADGVLLEFGPSRQQDLALRIRIRQWHPYLRMLFIACVVLRKYCIRVSGFELPKTIQGMADRMEGTRSAPMANKREVIPR